MNKQGKVWGETVKVAGGKHWSIHVLHVHKGGFCSEHKHSAKINIFYVISGQLAVTIQQGGRLLNPLDDVTILNAGDRMVVPIEKYHKFTALEDTVCLEIYEGVCVDEDIDRRDQGGMNESVEPDETEVE